ncbi:MAG: hypothetical protein Q9177_004279 [Variospora cf. flavescens]
MHFSKIILPFFVAFTLAQDNDNNDDNNDGNDSTALSVPGAGSTPTITSVLPGSTGNSDNDVDNDVDNDGNDDNDDGSNKAVTATNASPAGPTEVPGQDTDGGDDNDADSGTDNNPDSAAGILQPSIALPSVLLAAALAAAGMM